MTKPKFPKRDVALAVLVAALGYFVDIYDLILFSIVRMTSLTDIGVPKAQLLDRGVLLLNMQMAGMLVGGILWGVLGDRKGRLSVLFGSILLYSSANVANGFVTTIPMYAALRFIAGVGLAGELGAGITLVSELLPKETRGIGTTIVATIGLLGAGLAWIVGTHFKWTTAYFIGGGLGLALLLLRVSVRESALFSQARESSIARGDFLAIFRSWKRAKKFFLLILIGVPVWYAVGILVTFSPEIGTAMGMKELPVVANGIVAIYMGGAVGDLASGLMSQALRSRKKVVLFFQTLMVIFVITYFTYGTTSLHAFYTTCFLLGVGFGYWALFVTMSSEQFGTNLRATATTSIPNFVRGAVIPLTTLFQTLKTTSFGVRGSAILCGVLALGSAITALLLLDETFGKDLDYVED